MHKWRPEAGSQMPVTIAISLRISSMVGICMISDIFLIIPLHLPYTIRHTPLWIKDFTFAQSFLDHINHIPIPNLVWAELNYRARLSTFA